MAAVLDNFEQTLLSEKMRKVSTGIWKRQSNGHMLITTIREKKEICHCVNRDKLLCKSLLFPYRRTIEFFKVVQAVKILHNRKIR